MLKLLKHAWVQRVDISFDSAIRLLNKEDHLEQRLISFIDTHWHCTQYNENQNKKYSYTFPSKLNEVKSLGKILNNWNQAINNA